MWRNRLRNKFGVVVPSSEADKKIEGQLHGTSLKVYWYMLKHSGESGVGAREVQRALGFSSPTLAAYHLEKLEELGLVEKTQDGYGLVREVKVGVLKQFVRVGAVMLPRYLFYATLFTTLLALYTAYMVGLGQVGVSVVFALIFGGLGVIIGWYETLRAWRQRI